MSNYLKAMFNQMKGFGLFKDYESYAQWRELKFGEKETLDDFKEKMDSQEKIDFNEVFEK